MKNLLFGLVILLSACSKEVITPDVPKPKLSLSLDPLLPIDSNGYYHFVLLIEPRWETIHMRSEERRVGKRV